MIGVALTLAIIAAVVAVGLRRWQRRRVDNRLPGTTIHIPIMVSRFDEIDASVQGQMCGCGGVLAPVGETSRGIGDRRYRIARLVCNECERERFMYFDVTQALH